jgi:uncharacterized protein YndB with AHSA1/START domain
MAKLRVSAERSIAAAPETVYTSLADMEQHKWFLPPAFSEFRVESGGFGAGTVTRFKVSAGGRSREYRMRVDEPQPGRVLTESDMNSSLVTTFTVTPEARGSRVRISTEWDGAGGVGGFFERLLAPRVMQRIYTDELDRLNDYARQTVS